MIPELQITVKPALGNHSFVKLKVVGLLKTSGHSMEGYLLHTQYNKTTLTSSVNDSRPIPS